MKLSTNTLTILKNFSGINSNLVIRPGNVIKTMSEAKNIMATATIEEQFPNEFGIYDLNEFLSVTGMFDNPELKFSDDMKSVSIVDGKRSVKYFFSDISILTTPSKDITMPPTELKFTLTGDDMNTLRKAAAALGVTDVVITAEEGSGPVKVLVTDIKDSTSNAFSIELSDVERPTESFSFIFNISNFKVLAGDYNVAISSKLISHFKSTSASVEYYIALEKSSAFGG
jgi:hypothetical protein